MNELRRIERNVARTVAAVRAALNRVDEARLASACVAVERTLDLIEGLRRSSAEGAQVKALLRQVIALRALVYARLRALFEERPA